MAKKTTEEPDMIPVEEKTEKAEKPKEKIFTVSALRGNCVKLFGCTSSTFDGAFYGCAASDSMSIADADKKIKLWLRKEIQ